MSKYYLARNIDKASPKVVSSGLEFTFEIVCIVSNWWGIYKADKAEEINALDQAVGKNGISEISEADYWKLAKKKYNSNPMEVQFTEAVPDRRPNPPSSRVDADLVAADPGNFVPKGHTQHESPDSLLETKERQQVQVAPVFAKSVRELSEVLNVSVARINKAMQAGAPQKGDNGYSVVAYKDYFASKD